MDADYNVVIVVWLITAWIQIGLLAFIAARINTYTTGTHRVFDVHIEKK